MFRFRWIFCLLIFVLASGCTPKVTPVANTASPPAQDTVSETDIDDRPGAFTDDIAFQTALLEAISNQDGEKLQSWMTDPFVTGWWRGEYLDRIPTDALRDLFSDQLGAESHLSIVKNVDLTAMMGGQDPTALLRRNAVVTSTFLVSGWGKDGQDQAVLFISRDEDNSLRWHGALGIRGGFPTSETGAGKQYTNVMHGYTLFYPNGFEILQSNAIWVIFLAPASSPGHRERAMIQIEPADGRTAEQAAESIRAENASIFAIAAPTVLTIDGEQAYILEQVPGQDLHRQVFIVHEDALYQMSFMPQEEGGGVATQEMEEIYAAIINSFHFLSNAEAVDPQFITNLADFEQQVRMGLYDRNVSALAELMTDPFTSAYWKGESLGISPSQAAEQIINSSLVSAPSPLFEWNTDLSRILSYGVPDMAVTKAGESIFPVLVSNWGEDGSDEAIFFLSRSADGGVRWQGIMIVQGKFPR